VYKKEDFPVGPECAIHNSSYSIFNHPFRPGQIKRQDALYLINNLSLSCNHQRDSRCDRGKGTHM